MAKIDKSKFSKEQWKIIKEQRRIAKELKQNQTTPIISPPKTNIYHSTDIAFVLGNGTSREAVNPEDLRQYGKIYGCNALYRSFAPDYLIAVDVKMILEINKSGYQKHNEVWTNPNKSYNMMKGFNFFNPSKGWSSGPTALWLASQHRYNKIYILGFDYQGLEGGKKFNNIYANTQNYKKSNDGATFFGNWLRQTKSVIDTHRNIQYIRVIEEGNYKPDELNKFDNFTTQSIVNFKKIFQLM